MTQSRKHENMQIKPSHVIKKARCPKCQSLGKDTKGDNLAVYSDGHTYCYGCGYGTHGKKQIVRSNPLPLVYDFQIPDDASTDIAFRPLQWLQKEYHFTFKDIIENKILWSEKYKWLIFPIENNGNTYGFQARNFNPDKPYKWFSKFAKQDFVKIYNPNNKPLEKLVLVEDIISAIRVSKILPCAPLFGSLISDTYLLNIKRLGINSIIIWLDHDKQLEGLKYSQRARILGISSKCLTTILDPKCYSDPIITNILSKLF